MSKTGFITLRKTLRIAVITEAGTGLALLLGPSLVSTWLLGIVGSDMTNLFARFFGFALLALSAACWPGMPGSESKSSAFRAMLFYNSVAASYIAYLGLFVSSGLLLWPSVAFHIAVTVLLVSSWRDERQIKAGSRQPVDLPCRRSTSGGRFGSPPL